jgi:hypothetical protein
MTPTPTQLLLGCLIAAAVGFFGGKAYEHRRLIAELKSLRAERLPPHEHSRV